MSAARQTWLVCTPTRQTSTRSSGPAVEAEDPFQRDLVHGLIYDIDSQIDLAQHAPLPNILGQAVQASEAVAGHHRPPVTDDEAFVVVL